MVQLWRNNKINHKKEKANINLIMQENNDMKNSHQNIIIMRFQIYLNYSWRQFVNKNLLFIHIFKHNIEKVIVYIIKEKQEGRRRQPVIELGKELGAVSKY